MSSISCIIIALGFTPQARRPAARSCGTPLGSPAEYKTFAGIRRATACCGVNVPSPGPPSGPSQLPLEGPGEVMCEEPSEPLFLRALKEPGKFGWPDNPYLRVHAFAWIVKDPSPYAQQLAREMWKGFPEGVRKRVRDTAGIPPEKWSDFVTGQLSAS